MANTLFSLFSGKPASPGLAGPPQGLLDILLGADNPLAQFADSRQNTLGAIGAGLAAGPTFSQGLANAAQVVPQARQADYQMGLYRGQVSQTVAYLQKTHPDLAQAVQSGTLSPADAFNMAFQQDHQQGVPLAPGATLVNPQTGQQMGGATPGGFYGTDLRSQAWNTVLKGAKDPAARNSDAYRAAWAIVTQPTMTPQGMMQPNVPAEWAPGATPTSGVATAMPAPASSIAPNSGPTVPAGPVTPTSASVSDMNMVAPPSNATRGPGIIPGTQPFNESQARTTDLAASSIPDLKRVIDGYPALMNLKDQMLEKLPGGVGRLAQTPEYKQAHDAMTNSMVNLLYFASGANLNKDEWSRKVGVYLPAVGDDPQTAVNKLDRFANDVMNLANSTQNPDTIKWAGQAVQNIKATEQQMLSQGQPQRVAPGTTIYGPDGKQYIMGPDGQPQPVM